MSSVANLRRQKHHTKLWDLGLASKLARLKEISKLLVGLSTIVKARIDVGDKTNTCRIPFRFRPLMI
jgi:hypothetical protein